MANTYITDAAATALLDHVLNNVDWANVGDAAGLQNSAANGNLYLSLHTATPVAGNQTTSEATYTSYARIALARDGSEWTVAAGVAENTNAQDWPQCTGGANTITHVGVGTDLAGAGNLLFVIPLTASLEVSNLITPHVAAGDLTITPE